MKLLGTISADFAVTAQLLIRFCAFVRYCKISGSNIFIDFKKAYDSVRREVLYNILMEFGIHIKLVRFFKMCLSVTYSKVRIGKHLSDSFPIQNGLK
jgi:hypothetical protein